MEYDLRDRYEKYKSNLLFMKIQNPGAKYFQEIVSEIFERANAMEKIFNTILSCFDRPKKPSSTVSLLIDFEKCIQYLRNSFQMKIILERNNFNILENRDLRFGNTCYRLFEPIIDSSIAGNRQAIHELEYSYFFYLLTDDCILEWAAYGETAGLTKTEVFSRMGCNNFIVDDGLKTYAEVQEILATCTALFLKKFYKPLIH